jgi:hypothetical protein
MLRLHSFNKDEALRLSIAIEENLIQKGSAIDLGKLDFIQPVNCSLTLLLDTEDRGIIRKSETEFECRMSRQGYTEMVELMQPFTEKNYETQTYQWLYNLTADVTPTEFLFSPSGHW